MNLELRSILTATTSTAIRDLYALPSVRASWTRITSANGGYLTGTFEIAGLSDLEIQDFYNRYLGFEIREHAFGRRTWEGFIYQMTLEINGAQYTRTLEPDWFHNRVAVYYSNAAVVDTEQGVVGYLVAPLRFQDTAQDFSAWQTLAPTEAAYRIQVANSDGSNSWGYLGAASTVTNPNDTIAVYQDPNYATPGWNDVDPIGPPAMTAVSYQVFQVALDGARYNTAWADALLSQAEYGTVEYVVSLGGAQQVAAETLRDRHITEFGYPRSRMTGGAEISTARQPSTGARLVVNVAGFVATLFWRYRTTSRTNTINALLRGTVGLSEFVTASTATVATNTLSTQLDCYPMPQRLGDIVQALVDRGDAAGNAYQWGVFDDRVCYYEAQPTVVTYSIEGGRLLNLGGAPVIPQLLRPGFLLVSHDAPTPITPAGWPASSSLAAVYVEQVEFSAPDKLRLTLAGQDATQVLTTQIETGSYDPQKARGGYFKGRGGDYGAA